MTEMLVEREPVDRCGIKHGHGDQRCWLEVGHDGPCMSKSIRQPKDGSITYASWHSKAGKFHSHIAYQTIYPANAIKGE